jgi:hypothetical protein
MSDGAGACRRVAASPTSPFAVSLARDRLRLLGGEFGQKLIVSERMREHWEIMFNRVLMRLLANRGGAIFQRDHIVPQFVSGPHR